MLPETKWTTSEGHQDGGKKILNLNIMQQNNKQKGLEIWVGRHTQLIPPACLNEKNLN